MDGQGTYLGDVLQAIFRNGFRNEDADAKKEIFCEDVQQNGEDLAVSFRHGESGQVSEFMEGQQMVFRQRHDHTQLLSCYSLFRLPRNSDVGWWAVHVNNRKSGKSLIQPELKRRFRDAQSDRSLKVEPAVNSSALEEAIENDQLQSVKLIKYDRSSDYKDARKWLRKDSHAQIELRISTMERGGRLASDLLRKVTGGSSKAYGEIVEFEGMHFDAARVQVKLDGGMRSFELAGPRDGHPFPAVIQPEEDESGPIAESVFAELGAVISEME
jgi:hypothetical protein